VLHQQRWPDGRTRLRFVDLEFATSAPPSDVILAALTWAPDVEFLALGLSPGVPRVESLVHTIGYVDFTIPPGGISGEEVRRGTFDWRSYSHRLMVTQGQVERLFLQRFAAGYLNGPCFLTSCATKPGQSGGPVLNAQGNACGIHSSGASTFFNREVSLGSMFYPCLGHSIRQTTRHGQLTMVSNRTVRDLIARGAIRADETIRPLRFVKAQQGLRVDAAVHKEDVCRAHDDFAGFQAGREFTRGDVQDSN